MNAVDFQGLVADFAQAIADDPRPRPTLRIGAIGHRDIAPEVLGRIGATLARILDAIRGAAEAAVQRDFIKSQFKPGVDLVILSPLAEGADRLIAQAGLDRHYRLGAILPFAQDIYEASFGKKDHAEAFATFRGLLKHAALPDGYGVLILDGDATGGARDASFLACAAVVTQWSEILIAIRDPAKPDSHTANSVAAAIATGIPVVLIDPADPDVFEVRLKSATGTLTPAERLSDAVTKVLAPSPQPPARKRKFWQPPEYGLDGFCREKLDCNVMADCDFEYSGPYSAPTTSPFLWRHFSGLNKKIESFKWWRASAKAPSAKKMNLTDLPFDKASAIPVIQFYLRYHRADVIATAYGNLHRSVQIIIVLLGLSTVTLAAFGSQFEEVRVPFSALEFVFITIAIGLALLAYWKTWLDRWLGCRLLAEMFRYTKFLLIAGGPSPFGALRGDFAATEGERTWTRDHAMDVLRAHRLAVPGRGETPDPNAIAAIRRYISQQCIDDQAEYHERTGKARHRLGEKLGAISFWVSAVTWLLILLKFLFEAVPAVHAFGVELFEPIGEILTVTAIVAPAFTAAIFALRAFGEYEIVGQRSERMVAALRDEQTRFDDRASLRDLGDGTLILTRLLLQHVSGWQELFAGKHLESG